MEVRRERRERRDRERERKTEGGREEGTCPFPPFSSSTHRITQALTALHKHAWIPTLPAGEEELLGQLLQLTSTRPGLTRYLPASQGCRTMRAAPTKFSAAFKPFCSSCMLTISKVTASMSWAFASSALGTRMKKNALAPATAETEEQGQSLQ